MSWGILTGSIVLGGFGPGRYCRSGIVWADIARRILSGDFVQGIIS